MKCCVCNCLLTFFIENNTLHGWTNDSFVNYQTETFKFSVGAFPQENAKSSKLSALNVLSFFPYRVAATTSNKLNSVERNHEKLNYYDNSISNNTAKLCKSVFSYRPRHGGSWDELGQWFTESAVYDLVMRWGHQPSRSSSVSDWICTLRQIESPVS